MAGHYAFLKYNLFPQKVQINIKQIRGSKRGDKRSIWSFGYRWLLIKLINWFRFWNAERGDLREIQYDGYRCGKV
jgi:hypothetical protein